VVGVGASAGGLEAISALLRGLPGDAPVGLVVLQHPDAKQLPSGEATLAELLARHTSLKVMTATDGALVEAGQVHVTPPGAELRIANGRLQLVPSAAPHLPIDNFFDSLARDRGRGAAGVVLSGNGADGSQGVCALRRAGASTFAQDKSALHSGMPEAATATGCVDQVLTPAQIATRLIQQTEAAAACTSSGDDAVVIAEASSILRRATGTDFSSYKPSTVRRRLLRRMALGGHSSLPKYLETLERNPAEVGALAEDLLIHVTGFFRDPDVFTALSSSVFPRLIADKPAGEALRVWVPGCSSGEEVYSLVMALSEVISASSREVPLKVFGTDLSDKAIERARAATYSESISSHVSPARLQRFFQSVELQPRQYGWQIRKEVRDLCVFARQDITRDPPFSNLDLVSCRNLMIYLSTEAQRQLVPTLHYALRVGGVLLLGAAETTGSHPGFEVVDSPRRIYRRGAYPSRADLLMNEPRRAAPSLVARASAVQPAPGDVNKEADRVVLAAHAPPGVVVTDELVIVQFRGATGPYLEPAPGAATLDLLRLVRQELRVDLRAVLEQVRQTGERAQSEPRVLPGEQNRRVSIEVLPLGPPAVNERHFIVLFRDAPALEPHHEGPAQLSVEKAQRAVEEALRKELASTRAYLQSVIEQLEAGNEELRAANEEVVSSNQELQSTNQEMQTAREELRATNEELSTVNGEMAQRNTEALRVSDDLTNVLNSVGIAIVLLGPDSRIRRFTPSAGRLLNLIATDVGRPLSDIKPNLRAPDLLQLVGDVQDRLMPRERTVTDEAGHWYQLTVRPYLTADGRVDGTVLTVVDVDAIQRGKTLLAEALDYAEGIVDTVRDPLLVLDEHRKVRSANRSFYRKFQVRREELEGKPFEQLGNPRWVPPVLIAALDRLAAHPAVEDARLEDTPSRFAGRSMLVSGRPLLRPGQPPWVLLAFEDLTEQMRSDAAVRRSERALREMLGAASEAILIANGNGLITYANEMAARTFGYPLEELTGTSIEKLVPEDRREEQPEPEEMFTPPNGVPAAPGGVIGANREVRGRKKDGTLFPAEVGLSVMEGEQGPLVVAFVSDVTARHEAEARISAYKKNLQEMAFDAALVEERQRRKLAMDLHDNIGQTLALSQIRLKAAQAALGAGDGAGARDLAEGIKLIATAITDTRELTFELSPPVLYDLGLPAAVSWLGEQLESQHHLHVSVEADEPFEKLEDETAGLLFRAVRECLTNVVKHARTREAQVSIHREAATLTVVVADQGAGFDPEKLKKYGTAKGFGLFSVREQIMRLGGVFEASSNPESGTRITLQIPLNDRKNDRKK
jgi:two-component system CheB/CheR fusion protein